MKAPREAVKSIVEEKDKQFTKERAAVRNLVNKLMNNMTDPLIPSDMTQLVDYLNFDYGRMEFALGLQGHKEKVYMSVVLKEN